MGSARTGGRMNLLRIMTSFLCCAFFGHIHLVAIKFFIHSQPEFVLQVAFYIESVLLIEVRQFFVPLMLGNVEFVAEKWPDTAQLQDTLAAIHNRKLVPAHKLFATMSSGKFKKGQALSKKAVFHSACPFLIHVFCLALFETQNYNILDGGAKWII